MTGSLLPPIIPSVIPCHIYSRKTGEDVGGGSAAGPSEAGHGFHRRPG